jgi:DNA ligase 1
VERHERDYKMNHPTLYKIDSMGRVRTWWIESTDEGYRTHAGLQDGKIVISGWQLPTEKNIGRANATTVAEQVLAEVASKYEHQLYQGRYGRTLEEAKSGAKFIECMLAAKYDPKKNVDFPYWSQPKLDGIRCLVSEDGMQSRNGKPLLSSPHIREALQSFFDEFPDVILDGELYSMVLRDSFEEIISLARKTKPKQEDLEKSAKMIEYHVYDVILPDQPEATYAERMAFIEQHIKDKFSMVEVVPTIAVNSTEEVEQKLGDYLESGYEGQMLRDHTAPYEHRRSKSLIKHKTFLESEFLILDIVEGKGNYAGMAKSLKIQLPDGSTQSCGMRGQMDYLRGLLENKVDYIGSQTTVIYQNETADGKLRFPVCKTVWKGKRDL